MIHNKVITSDILLPTVSANIVGPKVSFVNYDSISIHVIGENSSNATILIERSVDGVNWASLAAADTVSDGVSVEYFISGHPFQYYRATVSSYVAGDITVKYSAA